MKYNQPYGVSDPNAPYVNGNPSTGTMGSIPPAASIEYPQREIVNLISDAGAAPSDADLHQLAKAVQSGRLVYADDTGTVNALAVVLSPNVAAAFGKGFVIVTKAKTDNTGPSTLSVNAAGAWPIVHATDRTPLNSLDINAGSMQAFAFDGVNFQQVWSQRQPGSPVYLTGARDYYVDGANGNDAWDGLTAGFTSGIHGPYATLQKAANQIPLFNLNGFSISFHVADYTYTWFSQPKVNGSGNIHWIGNPAVPANCVINGINRSAVMLFNIGCTTYFDGFKVMCAGSQAGDAISGINAYGATTQVSLGAMEFGAAGGSHISSENGALVSNTTPGCPWKITGGASGSPFEPGCFIFCYVQGNVIMNAGGGPAITIPGAITLNGGFIFATNNSFVNLAYTTLTGAANVTGQRYNVNYNSSISTGSGDPNYYPGTIAGAAANGGYYT